MSLDADLLALRRRFETDPSDAEARWSYIVALLRAGRREVARALLKGRFLCPLEWEELPVGEVDRTRWCEKCENTIQWCSNADELRAAVGWRMCVAAPTELVEAYADEQVGEVAADPEASGRPERCVLEVSDVGVATVPDELDPSVLARIPGEQARDLRALPVAFDVERRRVAVITDAPLTVRRAEDVRLATGHEVTLAGVVDPITLDEALTRFYFPTHAPPAPGPLVTMGAPLPPPPDPSWKPTAFDVVLREVGRRRIEVMREVRAATELDLAGAKALVGAAPTAVLRRVGKERAEAIAGRLRAAGATVEIEEREITS